MKEQLEKLTGWRRVLFCVGCAFGPPYELCSCVIDPCENIKGSGCCQNGQ